jgi:hypothetical protein
LEQILSRENMLAAWKRVKANKGAAGMDQMSTDEFAEFARHHWERIRSAIRRQWTDLHYGPARKEAVTAGTARCGPACRVVWEGGS